jgi:cation diffusion facilitator CzcD-associated flavoprotein CzcO
MLSDKGRALIDVAIVGAGPYGLSLAAHLEAAGVSFRVFGKTMDSWKSRMPPGMLLKSHPWSSFIYDPEGRLTFEKFCRQEGLDYHSDAMETSLELFCRYGEAFQKIFAPDVVEKTVADLTAVSGGFRIVLDDGEAASIRSVACRRFWRPCRPAS